MATIAELGKIRGFTEGSPTTWLISANGTEDHGAWNPSVEYPANGVVTTNIKKARYGGDLGVGYATRNGGLHGDRATLLKRYLPGLMDFDSADLWADWDIDYVEGLSTVLFSELNLAVVSGKVTVQSQDTGFFFPQSPAPSGSVPGPGTSAPAPFQSLSDREVAEKTAAMAVQALASLGRIEASLDALGQPSRTVVPSTSSATLIALQTLKTRAAEIDSHHEEAKHRKYDALLAAVNTAVKEGNA